MKLTENTLVPVSLVITVCSGIYMFAKVSLATDVNTRDIDGISSSIRSMQVDLLANMKEQSSSLSDLRTQTATIDTKLNSVSERLNRVADKVAGRSK